MTLFFLIHALCWEEKGMTFKNNVSKPSAVPFSDSYMPTTYPICRVTEILKFLLRYVWVHPKPAVQYTQAKSPLTQRNDMLLLLKS